MTSRVPSEIFFLGLLEGVFVLTCTDRGLEAGGRWLSGSAAVQKVLAIFRPTDSGPGLATAVGTAPTRTLRRHFIEAGSLFELPLD